MRVYASTPGVISSAKKANRKSRAVSRRASNKYATLKVSFVVADFSEMYGKEVLHEGTLYIF